MAGGITSFVVFGATGDLARRKLLPALFTLFCRGQLADDIHVVGFARSAYSDDTFRDYMWNEIREFPELSTRQAEWSDFSRRLTYVQGSAAVAEEVAELRQRLEDIESGQRPANRLFYLSISPSLYAAALRSLGSSGLASEDAGWRRVVIEKPFGQDLASAQALNRVVNEVFQERQVFHIDHYLGKETVQNILVLRFANAIFEPLWNRNYIDNIQITVAESLSVGSRGGYYDRSGVVRDMVQNHLLQLLALIAMEPPSIVDAESLREKKVEVLRAIRRWSPDQALQNAVGGQYQGYLREKGVFPLSSTATYAALRLYIDNWRWQGVPFYLRTGKGLAEKRSQVVIQFRDPPLRMFSLASGQRTTPNMLGLILQPDEGAILRFQVKLPGTGVQMQPVNMAFAYESAFQGQGMPEAYEHLLQDALNGDASDFIRSDQIEQAWRVVDPLLKAWDQPDRRQVHVYERGSWGPEAADALLAQDGRSWLSSCNGHERAWG